MIIARGLAGLAKIMPEQGHSTIIFSNWILIYVFFSETCSCVSRTFKISVFIWKTLFWLCKQGMQKKQLQARIKSPTRIKISRNEIRFMFFSQFDSPKPKIEVFSIVIHLYSWIYIYILHNQPKMKTFWKTHVYSVLEICKQGKAAARIDFSPNKSLSAPARTRRVRALFLPSPRAMIMFVWTLSVVFLLLHVFDYFETFLKWIIFFIFCFITSKITYYSLQRLGR